MRGLWSKMRVTEAPAPASAGGGSRSNTLLTTSNMAVLNIGSLNLDYVYRVDHFVRPGETLAASHRAVHAGGKGLNQSVALARAGATVLHAGCVGADGGMLLEVLKGEGVDVSMLAVHESEASGHTFIQVTEDGENGILYYPGTNGRVTVEIPAGKLTPGEDPLEAASRELLEETGMTAGKIAFLTTIASSDGFCDELIHIYMATGLEFSKSSPDADEFINVDLVELSELVDAVLDGRIEDAKTVVGALLCDSISHRLNFSQEEE